MAGPVVLLFEVVRKAAPYGAAFLILWQFFKAHSPSPKERLRIEIRIKRKVDPVARIAL